MPNCGVHGRLAVRVDEGVHRELGREYLFLRPRLSPGLGKGPSVRRAKASASPSGVSPYLVPSLTRARFLLSLVPRVDLRETFARAHMALGCTWCAIPQSISQLRHASRALVRVGASLEVGFGEILCTVAGLSEQSDSIVAISPALLARSPARSIQDGI